MTRLRDGRILDCLMQLTAIREGEQKPAARVIPTFFCSMSEAKEKVFFTTKFYFPLFEAPFVVAAILSPGIP